MRVTARPRPVFVDGTLRPGQRFWGRLLAGRTDRVVPGRLEGYDPARPDRLFDRVVRTVETADGPVDCYLYLAGAPLAAAGRPVVADGDWVAHFAARG